ncbi:MAG: alpha/beta fold hydrolase [Dehalococcoidia bacterium]
MPTAAVNGIDLHYESDGAGAPLIALHGGLGFDHTYMRRSFARLSERHTLICPDLRCNGLSLAPIETLSMEQLADDVAGLMEALEIEKATILGHSYGGFVAQEFCIRHPARAERLVLVDTTPGNLGADEVEKPGLPIPEEMLAVMSRPPATDEEVAEVLQRLMPFYLHSATAADGLQLLEGTNFRAAPIVAGLGILAGWSCVDRLKGIRAPTLALWGRHDVVCSPPQAERIVSRIADAELHTFEMSGHFPWVDEPARCVLQGARSLVGKNEHVLRDRRRRATRRVPVARIYATEASGR